MSFTATHPPPMGFKSWLISRFVVPRLYGRGRQPPMRDRIAENRKLGPAAPSAAMQDRYAFQDARTGALRIFRLGPKGGASPNRILYLHGGAYVYDLSSVQWVPLTALIERTGAEVIAPLYPLAPESTVEAGLDAAEAAWLQAENEVGAGRVVILGDSAGGGLALALAQRLASRGARPAALVLYFPWLDATVGGSDQVALQKLDPLLGIPELREAGRMWAGSNSPRDPRVSPLFGDQGSLPPTLVLTGTHDLLLSDTRRFARACPKAFVVEYPKMFHGWVCAPIPEAVHAWDTTAAFLNGRWS